MGRKIYNKSEFRGMANQVINTWTVIHKQRLIGSLIFTANNGFTSRLVRWAESWSGLESDFVPSHVGSIVEKDGQLYVFQMIPPKSYIQPLTNYLLYTNDEYKLILRDFELDTKMFSANILEHNDEIYPYLSALRSVFTKRQSKRFMHCSELPAREYHKQGYLQGMNLELTPLELYQLMINGGIKK